MKKLWAFYCLNYSLRQAKCEKNKFPRAKNFIALIWSAKYWFLPMKLAMYFSPLKAVKKKWINNSFKTYFAVQLDNLSFNHSVNLYCFFLYHHWSIFFLFEYYFILNFWAVSCWLKYKEEKRSSYQLYGYTCKKLST